MLVFPKPLTLLQFLIPTIGTGILFSGILFYGYMAARYRSKLYISMAFLAVVAFGFVGSEMMILSIGSFLHNWKVAIHFQQTEQLSGTFFIFALPLFVGQIVTFGKGWHRVNTWVIAAGAVYALVCVAAVFINADLFISSTVHTPTWLQSEADYGRGQEGILYFGRDLILAVVVLYTLVSVIVGLVRNGRSGYLLFTVAGLVIAILTAASDVSFVYTGVNFDFFPYVNFSRFSLGLTLFIILLLSGLTRHFIDVAKEIDKAHRLVTVSEGKYRVLVEGTNDLVFTLDEDLKFLSANRAALHEFSVPENNLKGIFFPDLIHYDKGSGELERGAVAEKISQLKRTGRPVMFKGSFVGGAHHEPKEFQTRMEYISLDDGQKEILCRAIPDAENTLARFLTFESQNFVIGNSLSAADELSKRLVSITGRFLDMKTSLNLRVCLREMLINAIEHGNLGITFSEKSEAIMAGGDYLSFVMARQNDPSCAAKKVTVDYRFDRDGVTYVITDDGCGFDAKEMLEKASRANENELAHGRGITMAVGIFDSVTFNEKGNSVTLVKKFR